MQRALEPSRLVPRPLHAACGSLAVLLCAKQSGWQTACIHYQQRLAGTSLLAPSHSPTLPARGYASSRPTAQFGLASCREPVTPPDAPCTHLGTLVDTAAVSGCVQHNTASEAVVACNVLVQPKSSASRQYKMRTETFHRTVRGGSRKLPGRIARWPSPNLTSAVRDKSMPVWMKTSECRGTSSELPFPSAR